MAGLSIPTVFGVDSDCLIYAFEQPETQRGRLAWDAFLRPGVRVYASTLVIAELATGRLRQPAGGEHALVPLLDQLLTREWLTFVDVTTDVALVAARIRAEAGLKLPDAINIAAATVSGAEAYLTNDRRQQRPGAGIPVHILDDLLDPAT
ncbi:MAG: type II toxin-antitoxin system VapC family toxin [Dehalococcoidia bacterium]|nr:type II toxin-antitoxin system VapC family toxin [Dehalococcoidia bacterium]